MFEARGLLQPGGERGLVPTQRANRVAGLVFSGSADTGTHCVASASSASTAVAVSVRDLDYRAIGHVAGIMGYALREARSVPAHALAAQTAPIIALTALAALRLSGDPFHEPFHARGACLLSSCYCA